MAACLECGAAMDGELCDRCGAAAPVLAAPVDHHIPPPPPPPEEPLDLPSTAAPADPAAPGWYPTPAGTQWWDGQRWQERIWLLQRPD